jgi:TolB-like protein/DNA-binding winged helix-turn-helix (wHTH) protein
VHEDRPKNRHSFAKVLPKAIVPPWRWLIIRPMARDEGDRGRPGIWRAGDIEVDVGQQRVLRGGTPVELPRLSFDMLLALMRAAPNFLTNEELMTRVWPGLVVSPETVTQRLKLLRDALGDDPRQPACIEGLRGRGYRIMVPVTRVDVLPAPAAPPARRRFHWQAAAAAGLVVIGLVAALALHRRPAAPVDAGPDARTAAILPFEVIGDQGRGQALASGLADSVLAELAGVGGLQVIATSSTERLGHALPPQQVGSRLGARFLVQGSIQEADGRLRVTAKLLDARNGAALWARQFDHAATDFFGLQDEVAAGVMRALEARIAGLDASVPAAPRSSNVEAQLAYLRGRSLVGRTTVAGAVAAAREFERARQLDPGFVPAIVGLYDARMLEARLRRTSLEAARTANAPLLAEAEAIQADSGAVLLARALWSEDPPGKRVRLFEEGLRKDPANVRALVAFSEMLDDMGRTGEAGIWLERALRIDPVGPRAHFRAAQRNFDSAGSAIESQTRKVLELDPAYYPALQRQAKYLWQSHGEIAHAIAVIEDAMRIDPENPWAPHTAVAFYLDIGDPGAAGEVAQANPVVAASTAVLRAQYVGDWKAAGLAAQSADSRKFGVAERWGVATALRDSALKEGRFAEGAADPHMGPIYNLRTKACALALLGQEDAALEQLAESFRQKDYTHWWYTLQFDPAWDELRTHRSFLRIATSVRAHVAAERRELEHKRRNGLVPQRPARKITAGP